MMVEAVAPSVHQCIKQRISLWVKKIIVFNGVEGKKTFWKLCLAQPSLNAVFRLIISAMQTCIFAFLSIPAIRILNISIFCPLPRQMSWPGLN